jgi:hypothetical protein
MSTEPAEPAAGRAFTMSRDDAIYWLGLAVFPTGLFIVTDHPAYGWALTGAGVGLLGWAARSHTPKTFYQSVTFILAVILTWGIIGYDAYARLAAVPTVTSASSADIEAAVAPVRAQRDKALADLAAVTKERDAQVQMIDALNKTLNSVRLTTNTETTPAANIVEPIAWNSRLSFYSGGAEKTIRYAVLYGVNTGSADEQLESATLTSEVTGESRHFSVEISAHRIDAHQVPVEKINPIPPGAEIELIIEWDQTISVSDFISQWGKARLEIKYGTTTYSKVFDRESISSMVGQDIVGADAVVGVPRVTPKAP